MDLRDASHEEAVEAIRNAGNPVSFLVQSIIHRPRVSLLRGGRRVPGRRRLGRGRISVSSPVQPLSFIHPFSQW